jgi:hypothetical protein
MNENTTEIKYPFNLRCSLVDGFGSVFSYECSFLDVQCSVMDARYWMFDVRLDTVGIGDTLCQL